MIDTHGVIPFMRRAFLFCLLSPLASFNLVSASEVRVWGDEAYVANYDPAKSIFSVPAALETKDVMSLSVGTTYVLALTSDKQVIAWGANTNANQAAILTVPSALQGHVLKLATNSFTALVLTDSGVVTGWGIDFRSILSSIPGSMTGISDISLGTGCAFAWKSDGTVFSWGDNQAPVPMGTLVNSVSGNEGLSIFVGKIDGNVRAWGTPGGFANQIPPINLFSNFITTGCTAGQFASVNVDSNVTVWGDDHAHLTHIPHGLSNVDQIALGGEQALVKCVDGTLVCWGDGATLESGLQIPVGWKHAQSIGAGYGFNVASFSQAPIRINFSGNSIAENSPNGTLIGNFSANGDALTESFVYSLVSGEGDSANSSVRIFGSELQVENVINYEDFRTLSIRVQATETISSRVTEGIFVLNVLNDPSDDPALKEGSSKGSCGLGNGVGVLTLLFFCLGSFHCKRNK